jgi:hypothetical protein
MGVHEVRRLAHEGGEVLDDFAGALRVAPPPRLPQIVAVLDVPLALHDLHAARVTNFLPGLLLYSLGQLAHCSPLPRVSRDTLSAFLNLHRILAYFMPETDDALLHARL